MLNLQPVITDRFYFWAKKLQRVLAHQFIVTLKFSSLKQSFEQPSEAEN